MEGTISVPPRGSFVVIVKGVKLSRALRNLTPLVIAGAAGVVAARRRAEQRRRELMPGLPQTPPAADRRAARRPSGPSAEPAVTVESEALPDPEVEEPVAVEPEPEPEHEAEPEPEAVPEPAVEEPVAVEPEPEPVPEPKFEFEFEPKPAQERVPEPAAEAEAEPTPEPTVTDIVDDLLSPASAAGPIQDATVVDGSAEEIAEPPDDQELTRRVNAALDAEGGLPEGVDVVVRGGRAVLRGQVERPGTIAALERSAAGVPGILGVDSLLHLPGTRPPASSGRR